MGVTCPRVVPEPESLGVKSLSEAEQTSSRAAMKQMPAKEARKRGGGNRARSPVPARGARAANAGWAACLDGEGALHVALGEELVGHGDGPLRRHRRRLHHVGDVGALEQQLPPPGAARAGQAPIARSYGPVRSAPCWSGRKSVPAIGLVRRRAPR